METLKLGLIGCGSVAGAHVAAMRELWENDREAIEAVAVCDVDEERAQEQAQELASFQGSAPEVYTDVERMLKRV